MKDYEHIERTDIDVFYRLDFEYFLVHEGFSQFKLKASKKDKICICFVDSESASVFRLSNLEEEYIKNHPYYVVQDNEFERAFLDKYLK